MVVVVEWPSRPTWELEPESLLLRPLDSVLNKLDSKRSHDNNDGKHRNRGKGKSSSASSGAAQLLYSPDYTLDLTDRRPPSRPGLWAAVPSHARLEQFRVALRRGHFDHHGWEGSDIGRFWKGHSLAGLLPFVYHNGSKTGHGSGKPVLVELDDWYVTHTHTYV